MRIRTFLVVVSWALCVIHGVSGQKDQARATAPWRMHTLFSVECQNYFDWQTVGLMQSYRKARQPGPITRLLSCTPEERKNYRGMHLAPTFEVPSMSRHPKTGDWYPAINKPAGVAHWLKHSKDAQDVDWVLILDADMIMRGPIVPWELGAEKGRPVAAYYGYLVGCDNLLAKLHTKHPELCDKVGGLLAMHIEDLRALAPMWLSKSEEVREDRDHWATNYTGDIYEKGWISEMYGYSFGAAEVGLRHKINDNLMIYPGYIPREGIEPILMHYGLPFKVGNWSFSKAEYHDDNIVYDCNRLFPEPPYPREIEQMEIDPHKRRSLLLNLECINTLNEGLLLQHAANGCPKPKWSKYLSFLRSKTFADLTKPKAVTERSLQMMNANPREQVVDEPAKPNGPNPKIHTIFSTECSSYFDWQTVGLIHSFYSSGQPGNITRLLSCTDDDMRQYKGHNLAPTHYVPSMSRHPLTGDWYPAINKPAAVVHWLNHVKTDAEYIVILDADMIMRGPITPWEFDAARGRPVSTPYNYLIGCDNELAKIHTSHPELCDKVGGVIIMHINDLRRFGPLWLHKTEEVRADRSHWSKNFTGDVYEAGWISEMYGYSFGAAELKLRHNIRNDVLLYPGYVPEPGVNYRVLHYGLEFRVGEWSFDKAKWRHTDVVNKCWAKFPEPPDPETLDHSDSNARSRDLISIECVNTLNEALRLHHERSKCNSDPTRDDVKTNIQNRDVETTIQNRDVETTIQNRDVETSIQNRDVETNIQNRDVDIVTTEIVPPEKKDTEVSSSTKDKKAADDETINTNVDLENGDEMTNSTYSRKYLKETTEPAVPDQAFSSSMRLWMIALWGISILGFVIVMTVMLSGRKRHKKKGKLYNKGNKKRSTSYSGFWDTNGQERQLRNIEVS